MSLLPAGQALDRHRLRQLDAIAADRLGCQTLRAQLRQIVVAPDTAPVDAQHHGRGPVAGRQHRLPVLRMVATHALYPPERVIPARLRILFDPPQQRVLFAQVAAQAGVDEAGQPLRQLELLQGLHRLIDHGVGGIADIADGGLWQQQRECQSEQRARGALGRTLGQQRDQRAGLAPVAQRVESQRLCARAQARGHLGQRVGQGTALLDGQEGTGRRGQLIGQGDGWIHSVSGRIAA